MIRRSLAIAAFALAALIGVGPLAHADPGRGAAIMCYVWANTPSPPINKPYQPSSIYSYNAVSRAQGNSVTKLSTGNYAVTCKGVGGGALFTGSGSWGAGGHVEVTAYGNTANTCHIFDWATGGPDLSAFVQCRTPGGLVADTQFDLLFVW